MTSITPDSRPRLAAKARLKWDRHAARHMLIYPERGLVLSEVAVAILGLCDGAHTFAEIVTQIAGKAEKATAAIEGHVATFLDAMLAKGLVCLEVQR
jgi:pyrroloquinoline quinone biosynthesis protein D